MQELEKILEEIEAEHLMCRCKNNEVCSYPESIGCCYDEAMRKVLGIIRKHMNDGWIPVEERLPEAEQEHVLACRRDGSIDTARYSPYSDRWYVGSMCSVSLDIIAWQSMPVPYRPERSGE